MNLQWALREIELLKRENHVLRERIRNLEKLVTLPVGTLERDDCLMCQRDLPATLPRRCPECDHVFAGKGWEGLDAHWKAHHLDLMSYETLWSSLCRDHRGE